METRYATGYRETEPRAARFRSACRVDTVETLEDTFRVLGRNSDAVIFNRYVETVRRARNRNGNIWRTRMANCIGYEISNRFAY